MSKPYHRMVAQRPVPRENESFANTSRKLSKNTNPSRCAQLHAKTRVSPKYPVSHCRTNAPRQSPPDKHPRTTAPEGNCTGDNCLGGNCPGGIAMPPRNIYLQRDLKSVFTILLNFQINEKELTSSKICA